MLSPVERDTRPEHDDNRDRSNIKTGELRPLAFRYAQ